MNKRRGFLFSETGSGVPPPSNSQEKPLFVFVEKQTFGSIIAKLEGYQRGTRDANRKKEKNQSGNWRFTLEHLGRELRKLYPPADTPPGLHALFTQERRRASAMHRDDQGEHNKKRPRQSKIKARAR